MVEQMGPAEQPDLFPALSDAVRDDFARLTLRAKCRVVQVNEKLAKELGFDLKVGQETDLGVFLKFDADRMKSDEKERVVDIWPRHHRSAVIDNTLVTTSDGDVLRDMDIKGGGLVSRDSGKDVIPWTSMPHGEDVEGLMEKRWAMHDMNMSQKFKALGIDVDEPVAVIEPLELPVILPDGTCGLVPIGAIPRVAAEDIKRPTHGVLAHGYTPALLIRKYGTKTRVGDVVSLKGSMEPRPGPKETQDRRDDIEDAIQLVRFKHPEVTDIDSYVNWFAPRLGKNISRMVAGSYTHRFLYMPHNVTLDCRITDRDSVIEHRGRISETERRIEFEHGLIIVNNFLIELCQLYPELLQRYGPNAVRHFEQLYMDSLENAPHIEF